MRGLTGAVEMEDRVEEFTVKGVLPDMFPDVAVIVVVPGATAVARPVLLIVATDVTKELQLTWGVRSRLEPSEYLPVAVNCSVTPAGTLGWAGVTTMEERVGDSELPPPQEIKNNQSKGLAIRTLIFHPDFHSAQDEYAALSLCFNPTSP
jgi:hypothetical protein